jgi:type IX secretion system PorP/SprF family membrane protein
MIKIYKKRHCLMLLLLFATATLHAQQDAQFTQYMYNTVGVNPGYAGSRDVLNVLGLYRTQWVGLDGAPQTGTFALHSPISDKIGMGFSVISDKIGPSDESTFSIDVSYKIPLSDSYRLFFGLKGTAGLLNVDYTKLSTYDPNDNYFANSIDNQFSPNVGAGLYLHSDRGYVGLSTPFMLATSHFDGNNNTVAKEKMHYYLIGGHVFQLNDNLKFKPAFLTKMVLGAPLQADLSANFLYQEKFTLGIAYRWGAAGSALAGFQISKSLFAGYSYDMDTTNLGNYNSGSHEVFLRFELFTNAANVASPRFF